MDDEPHAMHYANKPQGFVTARRRQVPVYNSKISRWMIVNRIYASRGRISGFGPAGTISWELSTLCFLPSAAR